ncbi:secreted protein, putative [Ixodes scapularis]|uniref:Secreted protein, putative n=1 Tax=Ixodes scapularis TaxID=6945 RepID=B7QA89_IXOSC|nr:secreted protein, putative [Ixodes scapularis]|eukprot:XP_002400115.1 secreted protein, putative [Ixodes scapularis]
MASKSNAAYGASIKDSNDFLDHVLLQKMPALVRRTAKLYPNATIGEFKFTRIPITVNVVDTVGRFEAMSSGRLTKVRTFHIDKIRFNTQYDKQLNLNAARRSKFIEEVEKKVNHELYTLLYNDYLQLLNEAVAAAHFPRL